VTFFCYHIKISVSYKFLLDSYNMSTHSDSNTQQPLALDEVLSPYFAQYYQHRCYPALIFYQGGRKMLQINVPAYDLSNLLQAKPSTKNNPDSGKNRPVLQKHAEEIKKYILERVRKNRPWVLGTITANVDGSQIKLIELGRGMGLVVIPGNVKLDITDGQHRIRAIDDLTRSPDIQIIGNQYFPITLILESDLKQCQTDFRDMAYTRPLDKSLLVSFGEFEGRIGIAKKLIEVVPMFFKKTEQSEVTPATRKEYKLIYKINYIVQFVSCAFSNNNKAELKDYDVEASSNVLVNCCNEFFQNCSDTKYIFETEFETLTWEDVVRFQNQCILSISAGLQILGHLFYLTYDSHQNVLDSHKVWKLSQLDWSIGSNLWVDNLVRPNLTSRDPNKRYKILSGRNSMIPAVNRVKQELGWLDTPEPF